MQPLALAGQGRDLRKTFPRATALDGVSFDVRRGEVLGLLGPNGAGKTTTLHMLLGLVGPTSGSVRSSAPIRTRVARRRCAGWASPRPRR